MYYNTFKFSYFLTNGGKLGLFDLFKKKSEEELFQEAVSNQDYMEIAKLGEKLLQKYPDNLSILNPYVDALVKLGKKEKAVQILADFGEKKIREEYYDIAIPVLKKALKIDPLNLKVIKLLATAYKKKELYYDAFKVLIESLKKYKEANLNTEVIKEYLEEFIQEQFHPLFYEKYADLLLEEGNKEKALVNYVLAANMYINLKNYKSALRALLKAQKIKRNENLDKQLIEVLAHLIGTEPQITDLLITLLTNYKENVNFIKYVIDTFREVGKLEILKSIAENIKVPKLKYALLALINFELGEIEEAQDYLNKLRLIDRNMYEQALILIKTKHETSIPELPLTSKEEEIPEAEEILEVLDQVLDLNKVVTEYINKVDTEEKSEKIAKEVNALKELEKDGKRSISSAEALFGLGNYDEAIKIAEKALNTEEAFKAATIIAESYRKKGEEKKALSFLFDQIKNPKLSEEEKAKLKALIGKIHEKLGDRERALVWYREANKILSDKDLEEKIEKLQSNEKV